MKIKLEINNMTQSPVEAGFFEEVARKTFELVRLDFLQDSNILLSLGMVSPEEIKVLNKDYRKHDQVTDILSFAEYEGEDEVKEAFLDSKDEELFLGELVLCYADIKEYAAKEGLDFEKELAKVFSHGILHLLGFAHGEKMFALQAKAAGL